MQVILKGISVLILVLGVVFAPGGSTCLAACIESVAMCGDSSTAIEPEAYLVCDAEHSLECAGTTSCDGDCLCGPVCEPDVEATGTAGADFRVKDAPVKSLLTTDIFRLDDQPVFTLRSSRLRPEAFPHISIVSALRTVVILV